MTGFQDKFTLRYAGVEKSGIGNAVKLSRSLSGVEAISLASAPLSQRFILPGGA